METPEAPFRHEKVPLRHDAGKITVESDAPRNAPHESFIATFDFWYLVSERAPNVWMHTLMRCTELTTMGFLKSGLQETRS